MAEPTLWAVLPVKSFQTAKTRLSPLLDATERRQLARLMFEDVLEAALKAERLAGVIVVTADDEVGGTAMRRGAAVLQEAEEAGTNAAVGLAVEALRRVPGSGMIVVPSDVPHVSAAVLDGVAHACATPHTIVLVPATRDGGTNLLASSPADLIETAFGPGSFERHRTNAAHAGVTAHVWVAGGLGLDLDRPDDLKHFLLRESGTVTHRWLQSSGIASRFAERNAMRREHPCLAAVEG